MKGVIITARLLSTLFRPTYYPTTGLFVMLTMTYLSVMPWSLRLWLLAMMWLLTVALPSLGTLLYRRMHGWSACELSRHHRRVVPYVIHLSCYLLCMYLMLRLHLPRFMVAIIVVSLLIQFACLLINIRYKVSAHSAGSGGVIGALVAYAGIFGFDPTWWLCGAILLSGLVMTSRMLLRQHTLGQVLSGTAVGIACGIVGVMM